MSFRHAGFELFLFSFCFPSCSASSSSSSSLLGVAGMGRGARGGVGEGGLARGEKGYKIGSHVLRVCLRLFLSEAIKAGCYGNGAHKADEMEVGGGGGGGHHQGDIIDLFN